VKDSLWTAENEPGKIEDTKLLTLKGRSRVYTVNYIFKVEKQRRK